MTANDKIIPAVSFTTARTGVSAKANELGMREDLRAAHDRNDEVLERIYIGRRIHNDTERLKKLLELYTKMTAKRKSA